MSTQDDLEFYQSRERDERRLAANAFDPRVKAVHLDMAGCYARRIGLANTGTVVCEPQRVNSS